MSSIVTTLDIPLDDGSGTSVPKTGEAVAGGYGGMGSVGATIALARTSSEEQRRYGDRLWDQVDKDAVAGASKDLLTYLTLNNDLGVIPAFEPEPGSGSLTPEDQIDYDNAMMAAQWVASAMDNLATPFHAMSREFISTALKNGAGIADKVWEQPKAGPDAGQLVLKALKPKDRRAWYFEVDPFFNLKWIFGAGVDGWRRWPREKFMVMTWGGRGGDPRGESIYTRAVEAWNFRVQLPEDHFRFLKRFGTPKVVGKLSPASMAGGSDGGNPGLRTTNPFAAFLQRLLGWVNGEVLAVGSQDAVEVHEVKTEGKAFQEAWDQYGREIAVAVLLQTRATMEAKHGSRADSGTGQDILGNIVRFLRRHYCQILETDVFMSIVAYRWGDDFARKYCPGASLGEVEHQDIMAVLQGLTMAGYRFSPEQFPALDKFVGIVPVRRSSEVTDEGAAVLAPDGSKVPDGDEANAIDRPRVVVAKRGGLLARRRTVYTGRPIPAQVMDALIPR